MTKQLLNEEIGRILEIMGTSQSTINESIGDDVIRKALRKLGKPIGSNANNVNALRSAFKTATKENFKLLLDTELKIFAVTINRAVSENKSEDEIINNLKTAYGKIFDDAGNFERYLRNRISKSTKTISKSTNTIDDVLTAVKSQPGFSKWLKQSGAEDRFKKYINDNSIRTDKLENTIFDLQRVINNEIESAAKIKDTNRKVFFQKTRSYLDGINTITGGIKTKTILVTLIVLALVFRTSVYSMWKKISVVLGTSEIIGDIGEWIENKKGGTEQSDDTEEEGGTKQSSSPTIEPPKVANSPEGWKNYCSQVGWACTVDEDGSYRTNDYSYYKYSNGTFVYDKETSDTKRAERKAEKVRKDAESRRRQQQGGTQQGGTEKEKPKRRTADDL